MSAEHYNLSKVLVDALKVVKTAPTEIRYKHNLGIYERFFALSQAALSKSDEWFHSQILDDFELFCLAYIRLDNSMPMLSAPWQTEVINIYENRTTSLLIEPRKIGKSASLSAYIVWRCCKKAGERAVIFAPTKDQLFVMDDCWKIFKKSDYLLKTYLMLDTAMTKRGTLGREYIRLGKNGSEIVGSNLAQSQNADTKRGNKGSLFVVDEIELVEGDVRETVIDDMMADTYSEKKMIMVGTPKSVANPALENEWEYALKHPDEIGCHHINIWEAKDQGCTRAEYISERFRKLRVHCPWGLKKSSCAIHEFPLVDTPEGRNPALKESGTLATIDGWKCNKCCLLNDTFVAENLGEFPKSSGKFFPPMFLDECGLDFNGDENKWQLEIKPEDGRKYVIGVDYGLLLHSTQVVVFEISGKTARLVYWEEIAPTPPDTGTRDYDPIIQRIKDVYRAYKGKVYRLYLDATQLGLQNNAQLVKGDNPIPRSRIFCNEPAKKKNYLGIWVFPAYKSTLFQEYRRIIMDKLMKVPMIEPFWSKFKLEHSGIKAKEVSASGGYLKFIPPKGHTDDLMDAMAYAMLSLSKDYSSPLMRPMFFGVR